MSRRKFLRGLKNSRLTIQVSSWLKHANVMVLRVGLLNETDMRAYMIVAQGRRLEYSLAICLGNSSSVSRGRPEATDGGRHIPVGNGDAATKRPEEYSGGVNELLVGQSELEAAGEEELKLGFWRRWIGIGIGVPMGGRPCATGILARTSLINGHNRTMDTTIKERHLSVVPAKRMD